MSGTTIPLFSKRTFTFSNLAVGQTQTFVVVKAIDVSQYTSGTLEVRVHSNSIVTAGALITVKAFTTAPTPEDPSRDFIAGGTAMASVAISNNQTAPMLVVDALDANFGGMLVITVEATQLSPAVAISADLSAVLTLKS